MPRRRPPLKPDLDETKRKFREALERKRRTHATAESADHTGKVHGSHGPEASRRVVPPQERLGPAPLRAGPLPRRSAPCWPGQAGTARSQLWSSVR